MNIQPVKTDAVQVPPKVRPKAARDATDAQPASEQKTVGRKERLVEALASEPAVRPEVLERAKELASDPDYPGPNVMAKLAARFIEDARRAK